MKPIAIYALIALLLVPVYPHFVSPNEFSRWVLAAAIVEDGSLEVSRQAAMLGPRFEDLSVIDGRVYSNKPPGLALVSVPGYALARLIAGEYAVRLSIYLMRLCSSTIPLLLLGMTLLLVSRRLGGDSADLAVFTLLFATPLFAYGLLLFSHALVAACLFGAWALLFPLRSGLKSDVAAGALMGLAVLCELPSAVPVVALLICATEVRKPARAIAVIAGGIPFALMLGGYNTVAFGGPLQLSYLYEKLESYRAAAREGIGLPSPVRIVRLLADPSKGLFLYSPVLIVAMVRFRALRQHLPNRAYVASILVPVSIILFTAGYANWHGGWTVGPRYILGAVPFLLLPRLGGKPKPLDYLLLTYSTTAVVLTSLVFPFVPEDFAVPWGTLALPLMSEGLGAPNLLHLLRLPFAHLFPVLLVAVGLASILGKRFRLAALSGVVLALAVGVMASAASARSPLLRLQRGYIADVYFGERGSLEAAAGGPEKTPPSLVRRRQYELKLPPRDWPFTY